MTLIRTDTEDFASVAFTTREVGRLHATLTATQLALATYKLANELRGHTAPTWWGDDEARELTDVIEWVRRVHILAMSLDGEPLDLGRVAL